LVAEEEFVWLKEVLERSFGVLFWFEVAGLKLAVLNLLILTKKVIWYIQNIDQCKSLNFFYNRLGSIQTVAHLKVTYCLTINLRWLSYTSKRLGFTFIQFNYINFGHQLSSFLPSVILWSRGIFNFSKYKRILILYWILTKK
jgi:hypothetical protein